MALVTTKDMFAKAYDGGYAIGAFNVNNMEIVQGITEAASELKSPVILQVSKGARAYANHQYLVAMVKAAVELNPDIPIALHLDHGNSFELAMQALHTGYTSIMIDGSKLALDENIALSKSVADVCRACGIPVEAELGKVGGKEDDMSCDDPGYTDPDDAVRFVNETGVTSLAVAIGTAHGIYKGEPKLDVERLSEIRKVISIPLVLHGASGVPDEAVKDCIRRGISKVNFATELRIAFSNGIKEYLAKDPEVFDPKKYCALGSEKVTALVKEKIAVCGSAGKA